MCIFEWNLKTCRLFENVKTVHNNNNQNWIVISILI